MINYGSDLEGCTLPIKSVKTRMIDAGEWILNGAGEPMCFCYKRSGYCWTRCTCRGDHGPTTPEDAQRAVAWIHDHLDIFRPRVVQEGQVK